MSNDLALAPDRLPDLPPFTPPDTLDDAAAVITSLGRNIHEHAYIIGKTLTWVKEKVGHGHFQAWVAENVWFSQNTGLRFTRFAKACDDAAGQLVYAPGKNATMARLPEVCGDIQHDPEPIIPEVVEEDDTAELEGEIVVTPVPMAEARLPGQEFAEEADVMQDALSMLLTVRKRVGHIIHTCGLSESNAGKLRRAIDSISTLLPA